MNTKTRTPHGAPTGRPEPFGVSVWALWFYIFIAVGRFGELIPGLTAIPLAKIAIGISLISLWSNQDKYPKIPIAKSGIVGASIGLLVIAGCLVPLSLNPTASMRFILSGVLPMAVAFYMINRLCVTWRHVRMTLFVLIISTATLAAVAITGGKARIAAGSSYDTNDLAYIMVTCLPIALGFAYASRGVRKWILYGTSALLVVATLLTQSRGGLLGAIAATTFLILTPYSGAKRSLWKAAVVGTLVVAAGYGAFNFLPQEVKSRIQTMGQLESDYNLEADNLSGRTSIWRRGTEAALERPIGYGGNTFLLVDLMHGGKYMAPHNSFLQIAVELGLLGLALLLRLYFLSWRTMLKLRKTVLNGVINFVDQDSKTSVALSVGLRAAIVANMVAGFFLSQAYSGLLWCLFAIFAAVSTLSEKQGRSSEADRSAAKKP